MDIKARVMRRAWPLGGAGRLGGGLAVLVLLLVGPVRAAPVIGPDALTFVDADIRDVVRQIGKLTGTTVLFDPDRVKGRITILPPSGVSPAQALELLRSALALHGYRLLTTAHGAQIVVDADQVADRFGIRIVPLSYARAEEVAQTLAWIAPPGVRVVPYRPTNSVIIGGMLSAVEELVGAIAPER
jgi:general secretion pathway protein D